MTSPLHSDDVHREREAENLFHLIERSYSTVVSSDRIDLLTVCNQIVDQLAGVA